MPRRATRPAATHPPPPPDQTSIVRQLAAIERRGGDGELVFAPGLTLAVSSLDKPFFPAVGLTKGGLMRYYARVAPVLLPAIDGRPLALKRYPDGVDGPSFFQHDPGRAPPGAVRLARVAVEHGPPERRYVGGDLRTLLHTVQLGTVAVNAWHSRVDTIDTPDYCVLDLDPGPDAPFARVARIAVAVRDALVERGHRPALKTSGSRGLHLLVPLAPGATYAGSAALAEEVAHAVAAAHPAEATVERSLGARAPGQVYVDHMQNAHGKTLAAVYSVRARAGATVSTPIGWAQLARPGFDPGAFTALTVPKRLVSLNRHWIVPLVTSNSAANRGRAADAGDGDGRTAR